MSAGELFQNADGKVYRRTAAGGHGGGATSYVDVEVSDAERLAYLKQMAERKALEADMLMKHHEDAEAEIAARKEAAEADREKVAEIAAKNEASKNEAAGATREKAPEAKTEVKVDKTPIKEPLHE